MLGFLKRSFKWSHEKAREYVGVSSDEEVCSRLLESGEPPSDVSYFTFVRCLDEIKRRQAQCYLKEWAVDKGHLKVVEELSLFELRTVCDANPYYLLFAFNVPFADCFDLMRRREMTLEREVAAHAMLVSMLIVEGSMYVDAAHAALKGRGFPTLFDTSDFSLDKVEPFPANHLADHPLCHDDPETVPSSTLMLKLEGLGNALSRIRERKFMTNRVIIDDGKYKLRTRSYQFVDEVVRVRDRAARLETKIRRAYKRLKNE